MERVLGYDIREAWCSMERLWPRPRRDLYLLRNDVVKPLSVDVIVWPTVFADGQVEACHLDEPHLGNAGAARPSFVGPCQSLWTDLGAMERAAPLVPSAVIAVIASLDDDEFIPLRASPAARWDSLGFDVADPFLLSGLTNCGRGHDREFEREEFGGQLNEHHLFRARDAAVRYAAQCSERIKEHAPFAVYEVRIRPRPESTPPCADQQPR